MTRIPGLYLGIHIGHNASCAIMRDGEILYVGQEERFVRKKNFMGFPHQALVYGMEKLDIGPDAFERVAYSSKYMFALNIKSNRIANFTLEDWTDWYGDGYWNRVLRGEDASDYMLWLRDEPRLNVDEPHFDFSFLTDEVTRDPARMSELFTRECVDYLERLYGIEAERVTFLDHHTCHAHYGYFASPFRGADCGVVVLDGEGDGRNQTMWMARGDRLSLIADSKQNDIGRLYKLATLLLAMRPDEHEYKVMGLAPYAKESYVDLAYAPIARISKFDGLSIVADQRPQNLFGYLDEAWRTHRFDNIAGAAQRFAETMICDSFARMQAETGVRRFVFSGGISMNIKANQKVAELEGVDEFFVPGSGADESLSIGACYALNVEAGTNRPLDHLYLGYDLADDFATFGWAPVERTHVVTRGVTPDHVAGLLADGIVVARVSGPAEFGARALGNRSILADPGRRDSVQFINEAIKNRDFWMPFALSIQAEHADLYMRNDKSIVSPFMTIGFDTRPEQYDRIQAGTHPYDRTVRPQHVTREAQSGYHAILEAFRQRTGVPALLNTSFNLHGEPITNTVADAISTFERSGLTHLLVEDVLVEKRAMP
jgi:carbamoyltransferase